MLLVINDQQFHKSTPLN